MPMMDNAAAKVRGLKKEDLRVSRGAEGLSARAFDLTPIRRLTLALVASQPGKHHFFKFFIWLV